MKVFVIGANGKVARHFADFVKEDSTIEEIAEAMSQEHELQVHTIVKKYADEWLENWTTLDWTIVHPGILVDKPGTHQVKVGMGQEINEIPRQDVAQTLISVLHHDNTIKQEFEVLAGNAAVEEAIRKVNQ